LELAEHSHCGVPFVKQWLTTFLNHYRSSSTTITRCFRAIRSDAQTFGWTEYHDAITIAGVVYSPTTGLSTSDTQTTDSLAVPTVDITAFLDVTTEAQILAGIWDSALVTIFEVNYATPPTTFDITNMNILRHGRIGRITIQDNTFQAEIRGLTHALDTRIGPQYTATCPWQLGDATCSNNGTGLDIADFTEAGTVSSVSSTPRLKFSVSGISVDPGWFDQGRLTFTSGANAGLPPMDIRTWLNLEMTMQRPLPYAVQIGDTVSAVWGDPKTADACLVKFNNLQQFRGFHFVPGIDALLENPVTWELRPVPAPPPDGNPTNDGTGGDGGDGSDDPGDDPGEGGNDSGEE
jgi:uncharacterized phage protein (TIGR02218 family)